MRRTRTTFEWMRNRLEQRAGIHLDFSPAPHAGKTFADIIGSQTADNFCELMDNRLAMGYLRYGDRKRPLYHGLILGKLEAKLIDYQKTGNLELLVDVANYCRLEFSTSQHPNKHFHAVDRKD